MNDRFDFLKKNQSQIYELLSSMDLNLYDNDTSIYPVFGEVINIVVKNLISFNKLIYSKEIEQNIMQLRGNDIISDKIERIMYKILYLSENYQTLNKNNITQAKETVNMLFYILVWYCLWYFDLDKNDIDISNMDINDSRIFCELLIQRKSETYKKSEVKKKKLIDFPKIKSVPQKIAGKKDTTTIISKIEGIYDELTDDNMYTKIMYSYIENNPYQAIYIKKEDLKDIEKTNYNIYAKLQSGLISSSIDYSDIYVGSDLKIKLYPVRLYRYSNENEKDYYKRINSMIPVQVGMVHLERQKYDIYSERLPVTIKFDKIIENNDGINQGYIEVNRIDARNICNQKADYKLSAKLIFHKGNFILSKMTFFSLALNEHIEIEGDYFSKYNYGDYLTEKGDLEEAFFAYKKSAQEGYKEAQYKLGELYSTGKGTEADAEKAFYWYEKAAENGVIDAQYWLGELYTNGIGVEKDFEQGFNWYMRAGVQGDTASMCKIGQYYKQGYYVNQNYNEALKWYRKAAVNGDSYAQTEIKLIMAKIGK